jgi:cytochrome c-type biogenesis protein CcmH
MSNQLPITDFKPTAAFYMRCAVIAAFILAGLSLRPAFAQESTPSDDEVNAIAKQLYCPVCENVPLDVCPTEACRQWRGLIRQQLSEGWTEDQIKQYFVENYGARVLAEPPRTGLNWLVYILPPAIILAGAFVLFRALRAWTQPPAPANSRESAASANESGKPVQDEYVARLEEELRKRK